MNEQLLPCAFCGCTKVPVRQGNGIRDYWLECTDCGASTKLREDGAGNERDWNRRPAAALAPSDAAAQPSLTDEQIFLIAADFRIHSIHGVSIEEFDCIGFARELLEGAHAPIAAASAAASSDEREALDLLRYHMASITATLRKGDPELMRKRVLAAWEETKTNAVIIGAPVTLAAPTPTVAANAAAP
ncbi:Lar family restriction alleviation protein, partial [Paraburkholderia unamae]